MSVGVVETTVPVANDIIMGEFKAYLDYGLNTQTLIGATRDGCKVDIERSIKEIAFDGSMGPTLDSDGIPLVRYEKLVGRITINNLYLKYFHRKKISDMESDGLWESGDWSETGGTYAAETTTVLEGDQAASLTADTQDYGMKEVFASAVDLTEFANGESSDTSDYIGFSIYITTANLSAMGATTRIKLSIHKDADETETNYFYYEVAASALTADQWNNFKILKSAFSEEGTASWSAVTGVSIKFGTAAPTSECTIIVDCLDLIQAQTNSSIVPMNGHGFAYTDETTYREFTPDLEITLNDYLENLTLVGQRLDGKKVKIVLKNCLNDGNISLALEEKDEVVNETSFTGHYKGSDPLTCPIELFEYVA
jgi:hypothetical protein